MKQINKAATDYAERVCNGEFPIEYSRDQVVSHTRGDFIAGAKEYNKYVLSILKENQEACKKLTEVDAARTSQDIINETYRDLIEIFNYQ